MSSSAFSNLTNYPFSIGDTLSAQTLADVNTAITNTMDIRTAKTNIIDSTNTFSTPQTFSGGLLTYTDTRINGKLVIPQYSNLATIAAITTPTNNQIAQSAATGLIYTYHSADSATPTFEPYVYKSSASGETGCWKIVNYETTPKLVSSSMTYNANFAYQNITNTTFVSFDLQPNYPKTVISTNTGVAGATYVPKAKNYYKINIKGSFFAKVFVQVDGSGLLDTEDGLCVLASFGLFDASTTYNYFTDVTNGSYQNISVAWIKTKSNNNNYQRFTVDQSYICTANAGVADTFYTWLYLKTQVGSGTVSTVKLSDLSSANQNIVVTVEAY